MAGLTRSTWAQVFTIDKREGPESKVGWKDLTSRIPSPKLLPKGGYLRNDTEDQEEQFATEDSENTERSKRHSHAKAQSRKAVDVIPGLNAFLV